MEKIAGPAGPHPSASTSLAPRTSLIPESDSGVLIMTYFDFNSASEQLPST
jgi:hypothetical protein